MKIHFKAIVNISIDSVMNARSPRSQSNEVSHRQYARSVRKIGVSTWLQICKDSRRCQGHYLHGYRILQHQVQIKFLEAPFRLSGFSPGCKGLWRQRPWVNNNIGELAAAVASVLSQLSVFIICCRPTTKLLWSAFLRAVVLTRSALLWMYVTAHYRSPVWFSAVHYVLLL